MMTKDQRGKVVTASSQKAKTKGSGLAHQCRYFTTLVIVLFFHFGSYTESNGQTADVVAGAEQSFGQKLMDGIDRAVGPVATWADKIVFTSIPFGSDIKVPVVLILLAGTAVFLTIYFRFINFRFFGVALRTARGKYTEPDAPGQITHFQALSTALSATVGLGNIAGVAIAIGLGGPGAVFWMVLMGFFGMTTKFCECTLGVKFRKIDKAGRVHGGAMFYLRDGFAECWPKFAVVGKVLAVFFAVFCAVGAIGAGNLFQVNQSHAQFSETFGILQEGWKFGLVMGILVSLVILGGIVWIARVTEFLVPFMCGLYVLAGLFILIMNIGQLPSALATIVTSAFSGKAVAGSMVIVLIQGIKRAVFSNEAGLGSAPIAHSAVKTKRPASEGIVALLEPFTDTVVVCTMTALVIVVTGTWKVNAEVKTSGSIVRSEARIDAPEVAKLEAGELLVFNRDKSTAPVEGWRKVILLKDGGHDESVNGWMADKEITVRDGWGGGIWLTSRAFGAQISWFPYVLALAVFLFAFSTMISWSYYGEQGVLYLTGNRYWVSITYRLLFCLFAIVGGAASLKNVITLTDALVFAMVFPNLIAVYFLLPVIKRELKTFIKHARAVDSGAVQIDAE